MPPESWGSSALQVILGPDGIVMDFLPACYQQIHVRTAHIDDENC